MSREAIASDKLAKPAGPFSPAVRANGFLFLSGQVAQDPATGKLIEGDVAAQTAQIFRNVEALLAAAGRTLEHVVKANVYLVDMGDFAALNTVYGDCFTAPFPARTTVGVAALPLGARVEIEVIAQ